MALPARGLSAPRSRGGAWASGGSTRVRVITLAAAAALLAVAILAWSPWRGTGRPVTLEMPAAPPPVAGKEDPGPDPTFSAGEAEAASPGIEGEGEPEAEAAAAAGDPAFFEMPMRVVRRSNIRARPTPGSTALGRADEGAMVILVEPKPERGYFRVATGELEGWIWGANLAPADPTQQPDPAELSQQPELGANQADPAAAPARQ